MPLLVAAIDFGTTYSGWAFSFKHEFEREPTKVSTKQWMGGQLVSSKGPTCVLINGDGKTLEAFGFEAESKYAEYAEEKCHKEHYFFKWFKMELYGRIDIDRNILIEDVTGKKLPAKTVFALSIKFMKDDLLEMSKNRIAGDGLTEDSIHWVLTVPAIWNDAAKQFMREAAHEADISPTKLTIALEPEAASICCRYLQIEKTAEGQKGLTKLRSGEKYIMIDAGGGTVDITVHEVAFDGTLKELHKASGGAWGGTKVDQAFEEFLNRISGCSVIEKLKEHHMEDYINLILDFEVKKREMKPNQTSIITFRIPLSLTSLVHDITGESLSEQISKTDYKDTVTSSRDKLRIEPIVVGEWFEAPIQSILNHVGDILKEPIVHGCSTILMAGGFSESIILQTRVRERFSSMKVIIPNEAGLVVMKGAVIFGHCPASISERISRWTYGDKTSHKQSPKCTHPPCRVDTDGNGDLRCYDIFTCHVKEGTTIKLGEKLRGRIASTLTDDQRKIGFHIYASTRSDAQLVTEKCCTKIGSFHIDIPDTSLGRKRRFASSFMFGGTEIKVSVEDKATGKVTEKLVDFLG